MFEITADFIKQLRIVLDPETVEDLQDGLIGDEDKNAVEAVDKAVTHSKTTKALVLYRGYSGGGATLPKDFVDGAFWVGSEAFVKADVVVKKSVPIGSHALEIGDGLWILPRDTEHDSSSKATLTLLAGEAFFNKNHGQDGKFISGLGQKYGKIGAKNLTETQQANREKLKSTLKKVAIAVVAVAVVALLGTEAVTQSKASAVSREATNKMDEQSEEDRHANNVYTLRAGVFMNQFLRKVRVDSDQAESALDLDMKNTPEIGMTRAEMVGRVDSAFANGAVPAKGARLYRGIQRDAKWVKNIKVGDTIQDEGFQSTTTKKLSAISYSRGGGGTNIGGGTESVIMKIKTKKNTRVMSGITILGVEELVLNRGQGLKITRVRHCLGGVCRITAETVD